MSRVSNKYVEDELWLRAKPGMRSLTFTIKEYRTSVNFNSKTSRFKAVVSNYYKPIRVLYSSSLFDIVCKIVGAYSDRPARP